MWGDHTRQDDIEVSPTQSRITKYTTYTQTIVDLRGTGLVCVRPPQIPPGSSISIPARLLVCLEWEQRRLWIDTKSSRGTQGLQEESSFMDNLLVRIHSVLEMMTWTGLVPWAFKFPFPGSLTSTSRRVLALSAQLCASHY